MRGGRWRCGGEKPDPSPDNLMQRVLEKADDLATLGHPHYEKTKNVAQVEIVEKIQKALADYKR